MIVENSIFLKNGKTVISVENWKFFRSRMMKRSLAKSSYLVAEFHIFRDIEVSGDTWHDHVDATWHLGRWTHGMMAMWCSK